MPIYEYQCGKCGHSFELLHLSKDSDSVIECPQCHSPNLERQHSTFAAGSCSPSRGFT